MKKHILLSTDFDGTLIDRESNGECVPVLAAALQDWKAAGGLWVVNTGRSMHHFLDGMERLAAPVAPDFAVLNERHVYRAEGAEWLPDEEWNQACNQRHLELAKVVRHDLEKTLRSLPFFHEMVVVQENSVVAGIVTPDESSMELAVAALDTLRLTHPDFDFQRNEVYLRFSHRAYTKGSALARIAQVLGTNRENTLAIGDNYNDRSMLDGTVAFPACPSNAVKEIREVVRAAGGWVMMKPAGEGTAEATFRFLHKSRWSA